MSVGQQIATAWYDDDDTLDTLAARIDEAVANARRKALEEACKVECALCRDGDLLIVPDTDNLFRHQVKYNGKMRVFPCNATRIHGLMEEVK